MGKGHDGLVLPMALGSTKHKGPSGSNFQPWTFSLKCGDSLEGNAASSTGIHAANFQDLNKAPVHLDGSWQTGRQEFQERSSSHHALGSSLRVLMTQFLFWVADFNPPHPWRSKVFLVATIPGRQHRSTAKNVSRSHRGILRTKSGLVFTC